MTESIVRCCDCKHWHTGSLECPMYHEETYYHEGWEEWQTDCYDNTPDDGSGFCHMGEKELEVID